MNSAKKEKRKVPLYATIALAVSLFFGGAFLWLCQNDEFYPGNPRVNMQALLMFVAFLSLALFFSAAVLIFLRIFKRTGIKLTLSLLLLVLVLFLLVYAMMFALFQPTSYVELTSPDGEHTIIILEDVYLFSNYGGDIYERTGVFSMKFRDKYLATRDSYYPFSQGDYEIEWRQDGVLLCYDDGDAGDPSSIFIRYAQA